MAFTSYYVKEVVTPFGNDTCRSGRFMSSVEVEVDVCTLSHSNVTVALPLES